MRGSPALKTLRAARYLVTGRLREPSGLTPAERIRLAVREWEIVVGWVATGRALAYGRLLGPEGRGILLAAGSEAGRGEGTPRDEVKPDVGWDRMSSADEDEEETGGPSLAEEDDVEGQVPLPGDQEDAGA